MADKKRVLIIGLDGFTWDLGRSFIAEGVMPHLAKLVETGCSGNLNSVIPSETSPAWSSFQTGCLPGKTGIFAFHTYDRKQNKIRLNSFADIAVPSIWELADRAGKKVVCLNMPVTSPAPKVNGVIIPGLLCPKLSSQTVHPPEAYSRYIMPHKDYRIVSRAPAKTVAELARQSIATERARTEVALELMGDIDWDIFCVQMQSTDALQHKIWSILKPSAKQQRQDDRTEALRFYSYCDEAIGKIVDKAGPDVVTLIVSDHGFGSSKSLFATNIWLRQHGYLELLDEGIRGKWTVVKKKVPPLKLMAQMYGSLRQHLRNKAGRQLYCEKDLIHLRRLVDFDKTAALCLGAISGILYINGSVQQRKELAKRITEELLGDFGPGSNNPVIVSVKPGSEVYDGPADVLPDLVLEFSEGVTSIINPIGDAVVIPQGLEDKQTGTHRTEGIFVANGPGIHSGREWNADIVDIAPTVLAYLGMAVPRHIDGKVLNDMFTQPIKVSYEDLHIDSTGSAQYSDAEQAEVEKHLTDLGYM